MHIILLLVIVIAFMNGSDTLKNTYAGSFPDFFIYSFLYFSIWKICSKCQADNQPQLFKSIGSISFGKLFFTYMMVIMGFITLPLIYNDQLFSAAMYGSLCIGMSVWFIK